MFIDTHAHLDDGQFPDVDAVIAASRECGVTRIINIGYGPKRWRSTLDLAGRHPDVAYCLGMHPSEADLFSTESAAELRDLLQTSSPVGIGEAGIDLFRDGPALNRQQDAFAYQIELAIEFDLTLVIHQRAAESEVYDQLSAANTQLRVVLHSFDASSRTLNLAIERGWHLGVGGLMTRASSKAVREVLASAPLDRLLLETDSPYLVPSGVKDRRNTPANIPIIAAQLATLHNRPVDEIERVTTANALAAFPRLATADTRLTGASI